MGTLQPILTEIVWRANTLADRLAFGAEAPAPGDANHTRVETRLKEWRERVGRGSEGAFLDRLSWDSWTLEVVRPALTSLPPPASFPGGLPAWAVFLHEVLLAAESCEPGSFPLDSADPVPFEEIILPFVQVASRQLRDQARDQWACLDENAAKMLSRGLLRQLAGTAAPTLMLEFSLFKGTKVSFGLSGLLRACAEPDSRGRYLAFTKRFQGEGLLQFFLEYSVLARLLCETARDWIGHHARILARFSSDLPSLRERFGLPETAFKISAIRSGLSDPHNGGQTVCILEFIGGQKLVYKPKNLGVDAVFSEILNWFNSCGGGITLFVPRVLAREGYGWMEFVPYSDCKTREQVEDFFTRAGALLALVYILEGTDCHRENMIAAGAFPVLIDLETLLHPQPRFLLREPAGARSLADEVWRDSVLGTGLLAMWMLNQNGSQAVDVSGLGGRGALVAGVKVPRWENINTDRMRLAWENAGPQTWQNLPLWRGEAPAVADYRAQVLRGFQAAYRLCQRQKDTFLAVAGKGRHLPVRHIHRMTRVYGGVLEELLQPEFLREGIDRSIGLEILARLVAGVPREDQPGFAALCALFAEERRALEKGDIPCFFVYPDSDRIPLPKEAFTASFFSGRSFDRMAKRVEELGELDLQRQLGFIRGSMFGGAGDSAGLPSVEFPGEGWPPMASPANGLHEALLAEARRLAEELRSQAIVGRDGSLAWIAPQLLADSGCFQLLPLSHGLYDGASGLALFFAALADHDSQWREAALGTLAPVLELLRDRRQRESLPRFIGVGGGAGVGSIIYALAAIGTRWGDARILEAADEFARVLTNEIITNARPVDLVTGRAGTVLALLKLHAQTQDRRLLEQAILCGDRILAERKPSPHQFRAWPRDEHFLTGLSHGAAGIAMALCRLGERAGEERFLSAAAEAIRYEHAVFLPEQGNWPDFRQPGPRAFVNLPCNWCHGAAGIGLGRLACSSLAIPEVEQDLEAAMATTLARPPAGLDYLCCGNLGRLELLVTGAQLKSRGDWQQLAGQRAALLLKTAQSTGRWRFDPTLDGEVYNPGFFTGAAGIGYMLLRLADPERFPSVLTWQ